MIEFVRKVEEVAKGDGTLLLKVEVMVKEEKEEFLNVIEVVPKVNGVEPKMEAKRKVMEVVLNVPWRLCRSWKRC